MSKHALEVYSDILRKELKQCGIKASVIEPSRIRTPIILKAIPANVMRARRHKPNPDGRQTRRIVKDPRDYAKTMEQAEPPTRAALAAVDAQSEHKYFDLD